MREFSKKYFENLKMSRKCIKKYVNFSILVKKMKYSILLKMTTFGNKNVHYGITYYKIMIKGHKRFKNHLKIIILS